MIMPDASSLGTLSRWALHVGGIARMGASALLRIVTGRLPLGEIVAQILALGARSLSITVLTAMFTGMVMAIQLGYVIMRFGATEYVGNALVISFFRELGPVLTTLLVGGRIGAGMTAELGSMAVTEQIDAIKALGADPIVKLVVPRVVAVCVSLPLLAALADIIGVAGGMLICRYEFGMSISFYVASVIESGTLVDYFSGITKTVFFGFFLAVIACYMGFSTRGGTEGVGKATTVTVVVTSVNTLILDFFLTKLMTLFGI